MLHSLPPLLPANPTELWYTPLSAPTSNTASSGGHSSNPNDPQSRQHQNNQSQNPHRSSRRGPPPRTFLSDLRNDEHAIYARKSNIRRFGAGWLKPPGIPKTLQALDDEKAEREEQELNAQREAALAEAQALQEEAEAEARRQQMELDGEDDDGVDLDADIPDADADGGPWSDEEDDEDDNAETPSQFRGRQQRGHVMRAGGQRMQPVDSDDDGWVDEDSDEDGRLTPLEGEGDYTNTSINRDAYASRSHMHPARRQSSMSMAMGGMDGINDLGMDADLDAGMEERDLDDDVPEAGEYEHTDTEAEDSSDDDDDNVPNPAAMTTTAGISGSSIFGSSPAAPGQGRRSFGGPAGRGRQ